jgi:hypothetical protein
MKVITYTHGMSVHPQIYAKGLTTYHISISYIRTIPKGTERWNRRLHLVILESLDLICHVIHAEFFIHLVRSPLDLESIQNLEIEQFRDNS